MKYYQLKAFYEIFKDGKIFLFTSRVDDTQRGRDIDLYIVSHNLENILEKKLKFLALLKQLIGYQKIDVIISKDSRRLIEQEAIKSGIEL